MPVERGPMITLALETQHRVGSRVHTPIDHPCEVYPQEGKRRVRHRVDQMTDQRAAFRFDFVVLPTEGNDTDWRSDPTGPRHPVAVEPGAIDEEPSFALALVSLENAQVSPRDGPQQPGLQPQFNIPESEQAGQLLANHPIVDDPRRSHPNACDATHVRFDLAHLIGCQPFQLELVGEPPMIQILQ